MTDLAQMQQAMAVLLGWKNLYTLPNSEGGRFVAGIPPTTDRTDDDAYDAIPKWGVDWGETMRLVTQVCDLLARHDEAPCFIEFRNQPACTFPYTVRVKRWAGRENDECHYLSDVYDDPEQGALAALQACYRACVAAGLLVERGEG